MEDREPYEEIDEILGIYNHFTSKLKHSQTFIYRISLEFPDKTCKNYLSSIKRGTAGTVRYNSDNKQRKNYRNLDPRTGKHCSPSNPTSNTTTRTIYENCEYSSKSSGRKSFSNSVKTCKQHAYLIKSVEPSEQIYWADGESEDQKL
ncbi:hypothetical protein RCL_jg12871.t2 [Rhizophagus clarus]|nr:hypothetical protein RCL_jg12871.t2 [Rhizophagus clarus]